jgi:hypothetical protein
MGVKVGCKISKTTACGDNLCERGGDGGVGTLRMRNCRGGRMGKDAFCKGDVKSVRETTCVEVLNQ